MIFGFTLQDKFGVFIALIITIIIAGLSYYFFLQLNDSMMQSLRTDLMDIAKLTAHHIDPDSIPRIRSGDENSRDYRELKKYLKGLQLLDNKIKSIYVMVKTKKENIWKFVADEEPDPKQMAHLNEEYDVSTYPEMKLAFGGPIADRETNQDKWGRWLSGYAPILDSDGHPVAIVGVDMSAGDVDQMHKRIKDTVVLSFAIGLALAIIFGRIGAFTITGPVMALLKGVRNIEEGKYGYKIEIDRRDEIGNLVKGFNHMSDKLGEVDKLKANFLSIISHELYTPITPIRDAAGQLQASADLSQTHKQLVGIIDRQTSKMQKLVDEVLDFSWLEIKGWKLIKEPVSLKLLGEEALMEMKPAAALKSIELKLKLGAELPTVSIDKKRIQHVLKILLDNALKFTPEQGVVTLEINRVSGGAEFAVADNGIGISKDNLEKIFTSFHQVDDHITRTKGGMGLGLAIAQRIVEAHNGYIWAESQGLGEGSRFVFLLPIV